MNSGFPVGNPFARASVAIGEIGECGGRIESQRAERLASAARAVTPDASGLEYLLAGFQF